MSARQHGSEVSRGDPPAVARILARCVLIDRSSAGTLTPENARAASNRRQRLSALPGMTIFLGRTDRGARVQNSAAVLPDGTQLPVQIYRRGTRPSPFRSW